MIYLAALVIGIVAGLRSMTAPAAVSWAARFGAMKLGGSWLAFLGSVYTPWILALAALGELVVNLLPMTPSRTLPAPFAARVVSGALCGAAVGVTAGSWITGMVLGVTGAIVGTLGGSALRGQLASTFHKDPPAALVEDAFAVGGAILVVALLG